MKYHCWNWFHIIKSSTIGPKFSYHCASTYISFIFKIKADEIVNSASVNVFQGMVIKLMHLEMTAVCFL